VPAWQNWQLAPPLPQSKVVSPGWHSPKALQHPAGQLALVQRVHAWAVHSSLEAHCWHTSPPRPQSPTLLPAMQNTPLQQPAQVPQVDELWHTPLVQLPEQLLQAAPPVPHDEGLC
jgi:hypothetical protein